MLEREITLWGKIDLSPHVRMATQRVFLFTIGGALADSVWKKVRGWRSPLGGMAASEVPPGNFPQWEQRLYR